MDTFNAAVATARYLQMIDPGREARAIAYTHGSHWLMLWSWLITLIADILVLRSAVLLRLRDRIQRDRPKPNLTAFACVAVFSLSVWFLRLPWSFYAEWLRERFYGLSNEAFGDWLAQSITTAVVTALLFGIIAMPIYALMRRTGRRWWAWSGSIIAVAAVFAIVVVPVLFSGVFNETRPVPAGPVRGAVEALARRAGIPSDRLVVSNGSKQSNRYTATVVGGPGLAIIQLSDTMIEGRPDPKQIRAVVAHEIGHYVYNHLLILAAAVAVLATAGLWLIDRLLGASQRVAGRSPIIQDPGAIPLAHMIFATYLLLTTPIILTTERLVERRADAYGLELAGEPDGAAEALLRTVDFRASDPNPLEEALFYDHPSIASRVRSAMEWKEKHQQNGSTTQHEGSDSLNRGPVE